jgi:hypothetical protein
MMELYFARCHKRRAYIVAPNRARALELAITILGVPSRKPSITRIEDEVILDPSILEERK